MTSPASSRWARGPLRPFRLPQYRWLTASVLLELFASGGWLVAVVWQVIELGGGPNQLSLVATALSLGLIGTTLLGGVLADRVPQRRILLVVTAARAAAVLSVAVPAAAGALSLWHLVVANLVLGMSIGFYFPAYSALLPSIVDADDLLAANGVEGMLRPTVMQAAGPALAGVVVATYSPAAAIGMVLALEVTCFLVLLGVRPVPLRRDTAAAPTSAVADLVGGVRYMVATPWFLATLLFACIMILMVIGPLEVLVPFVVKDGAGGGPTDHAWVLAGFGIGGAVGSLAVAMFPLPRRYLTVMNLMWGLACVPMVVLGFATSVPLLVAAMFVVGALFSAPMVIWGTLLQRRVPPEMLGRASSLDFFVSLALMPVSMALAGPVSEALGLRTTFVVVGLVPLLAAALAITLARMPVDELAHPLDRTEPSRA